nr:MAG: DNA pilot protein [Microvirus sp.]
MALALGAAIKAGLGIATTLANIYSTIRGSTSSARNQNTMGSTISSGTTMGSTAQDTTSTGGSTQTGNTGALGNLLSTALGTPTGNNTGAAANFNASQAQTANNLQGAQWNLGNIINMGSMLASNAMNAASQSSAMRYNSKEAKAQRDWQERMSSTSYQRGVKDLEAAGLNPVLAAYNGFGAQTPSGAYGSLGGGQTFGHTQAMAIPAAKNATMQAMYDYGNNTAQIVENYQAAINSAKQSSDYWTAEHLEQMQQQTVSNSAQTVGQLAEAGRSSSAQTSATRENTDSKQINVGGELSGEWTNKKDRRR